MGAVVKLQPGWESSGRPLISHAANEDPTDRLAGGISSGRSAPLQLLASGVVVRPHFETIKGELVQTGEMFGLHLDQVEVTQLLAAALRRIDRLEQQLANLEDLTRKELR